LLEFGFGVFLVVRVFVRVPLHGELSIGFFEVIVLGAPVYLENLVVIHAHAFSSSSSFSVSDFFFLFFLPFLRRYSLGVGFFGFLLFHLRFWPEFPSTKNCVEC
jgi:hypothetical protein